MTAVYSTRFLAGEAISGTLSYTVPAGYRAVVKEVDGLTTAASSTFVGVQVAGIWIYSQTNPGGSAQVVAWRGMYVAYAGEEITIATSQSAAGGVNGYLFEDP
jgi:hypothetical protein